MPPWPARAFASFEPIAPKVAAAAGFEESKLSKKRSTGRIDGMIALVMALGVASLRTPVKFDVEALIG